MGTPNYTQLIDRLKKPEHCPVPAPGPDADRVRRYQLCAIAASTLQSVLHATAPNDPVNEAALMEMHKQLESSAKKAAARAQAERKWGLLGQMSEAVEASTIISPSTLQDWGWIR